MDMLINVEEKATLEKMYDFLKTLTVDEQEEVNNVLRGIAIGIQMKNSINDLGLVR